MSVIDEARSQLQGRARKQQKPWSFPDPRTALLQHHRVLVFDGTLTNAGWVFMENVRDGINVIDKGTLRPETTLTGYEETWEKALQLDRLLSSGFFESYARSADSIVVEAPAVKGFRIESSLIAGLVIMLHFQGCRIWSVSATHVSAVLLNNPKVVSAQRKPLIRDAVIRLYPGAAGRDWNEHERDGLATGAVHLFDEKGKCHE